MNIYQVLSPIRMGVGASVLLSDDDATELLGLGAVALDDSVPVTDLSVPSVPPTPAWVATAPVGYEGMTLDAYVAAQVAVAVEKAEADFHADAVASVALAVSSTMNAMEETKPTSTKDKAKP